MVVGLTGIVPIFAVYLYFVGVSYVFYLFADLGLSLSAVDIPFYYYFVYSYGAVFRFSGWNILLFLCLVIAICLIIFYDSGKRWVQVLLVIITLILFPISSGVAASYARAEATAFARQRDRTVRFVFKTESTPSDSLKQANDDDELFPLMVTADKVFAARVPDDPAADMDIFIVPITDTSEVRISVRQEEAK